MLTACIDPSGTGWQGVRNDPLVRLADYAEALRFWLSLPDPRLRWFIFLENSGYPLDVLRKIAADENPLGKEVEFVPVSNIPCPAGVSYGFREFAAIDEGLEKSELARRCEYWIKVTGRLTFPTISRLLDRLPPTFDFSVDTRDNRWLVPHPQRMVTVQLMIFRKAFYDRELKGLNARLTPELPLIESAMFNKLVPYHGNAGAILRWPVNCDPRGQAAHWNKDYGSLNQRCRNTFRAICRRIAPNWWC